jgi:hypothetical protein
MEQFAECPDTLLTVLKAFRYFMRPPPARFGRVQKNSSDPVLRASALCTFLVIRACGTSAQLLCWRDNVPNQTQVQTPHAPFDLPY